MSPESPKPLADLLAQHRDWLAGWLKKHASGLLGCETVDDLVQGVHLHALEVESHFEWRSEREFVKWLEAIARQHVADRHAYWSASKRVAGALIRITSERTGTRGHGVEPKGKTRGPSTRADASDQLAIAARAIDMLLPRDQEFVRAAAADEDLLSVAKRLGISYDAAERARLRALDRFRRTFELLARRS